MKVGKTFYARNRREWRSWLARHHKTAPEIWLIYYKKHSGKPRVSYNDAVDEALCYGWIDSILKPIDADCYAQRFSPRRPTSRLSEMNRERVRRLIASRRTSGDACARTPSCGSASSASPNPTGEFASAGSRRPGIARRYSSSGCGISSR